MLATRTSSTEYKGSLYDSLAAQIASGLAITTDDVPDYLGEFEAWMHPGQRRMWESVKRFITVLAGTQGGKTVSGPWWLFREIQRCGEGDYIAATATYDLFKLKMLPALLDVFVYKLGIGEYKASDRVIEIKSLKARIILRSAESGGGLESTTAKGAWLDEAGQDSFTIDAWEAVLRRLSIHQGRALLTTTIYNLGWLKSALYDPWVKASGNHPDIDVIQFDSTENPAFPVEEYERARDSMPLWKFNMFYRGRYERPAGLIYDCFDYDKHTTPWFFIPDDWPRFGGLDFGGVNTAGIFIAEEPGHPEGQEKYFVYREYHAGNKTVRQHKEDLMAGEPTIPYFMGGSKSEKQWRDEYGQAGLPVREPPQSDVEVGIGRGISLFRQGRIKVFTTCTAFIDQLQSYARKIDANGETTEEIADKAKWHLMDAYRYIANHLADDAGVGVY